MNLNIIRLVGVDLGTSRTRIWTDRGGFVLDEPSCLAVDSRSKKVIAVGEEAWEMQGRVGKYIEVKSPIKKGQVYDLDVATAMMKLFWEKAVGRNLVNPIVMVNISASSTDVSEKITTKLFYNLGAKEVYTISQPLAAVIGAGVPIADASGGFILQMGAGVVEGAVISLGGMVAYESSFLAGEIADERIVLSLRKNQQIILGMHTAEKVKKEAGSVIDSVQEISVGGKNLSHSSPQEIKVNSLMIAQPLTKLAIAYEGLLKKLLAKIPPELTVDIIDKGLLLSGGLSQMDGLEEFFIERLGIPVSVVEEPEDVVIKGIGTVLRHLDEFKESLGYI